ncbi:MAG: ATP-binding protein [Ferruginibacter sp.]
MKQKKKIAILLPNKEDYSKNKAAAASIWVKDFNKGYIASKQVIFGISSSTSYLTSNFINLRKKNLINNSYFYIQNFIKTLPESISVIVIHNRPHFFFILKKKFPKIKFVLVFHNDPNTLRGSRTVSEKINILEAGHTVSNVGYFIGYFNQDKDLDMKSFVNWNASANLYDILNINSTFKGDILENWLKLFHVDDIDKGINHCADAILKNKNIDIKMRTKGTTEADVRWLKFNGKVEYNNAGRPMVLILYIEDITNLETLVRDRGLIIESITDYFYVVDEHFNFIYYNKKYGEKYLKVNGDECIGKNFHDLFPGAVETEFLAYFKQAMETKELVKCDFMVTEMGEYNGWFEQSFYPFASGCSVLFRDISARKNSEKELLLLNEQLKISSKELINTNIELERFAYVASHDLQEPLRMVSSFIQLFEKKYSDTVDDTGKQYIRFAVDGAERMKTLIRDLLQYSRAGSGPLEIIDVDMNEVMKEVQMIFRNETINMHVDIIIQHLPVIRANTSTMLQLMQNLVGNAIKYNDKERPIIKVSGSENDTEWIISVKDNGIGIDPEFSDKIFVIFKRLHAKDKYSGTGIGLSV